MLGPESFRFPNNAISLSAISGFTVTVLTYILDPEFRKPVEVSLDKMSQDEKPCIILYSDAMYEDAEVKLPDGRTLTIRNMPVAVYCHDQADGQHYSAHLASIPDEFYVNFPTLDNYVTRGEIVAHLAAFHSKPELFAGRRVISFIDNATALSNLATATRANRTWRSSSTCSTV